MPKGRKKGRRQAADSRQPSDEEYDTADNSSVVSGVSDIQSIAAIEGGEEVDDFAVQEDFEDKLKDCIEGITQKSVKGRVENLRSLQAALSKKYLYEFVTDRRMTIGDALERCIKKGKGEEQALAALCSVLLCLQLGGSDDGEEVYRSFKHILATILADTTASTKARSACATALGILSFLAGGDLAEALQVMKLLENIFKASYLKGDGTVPNHTADITSLHNSALISWCLLLSIAPSSAIQEFIDDHLCKLPQLLESKDVELRITAGEAIALMYELAREEDEEFEGEDILELCEQLKELATDSNKYRAKKDRRQQRSSFRDILRAVEEGDVPHVRVQVGLMESLHIDSWARKRQYDCLCQVIGSGMSVQLQENDLVRDIFGLGPPIPVGLQPMAKISKNERVRVIKHLCNAAAFKARTKARAKTRDKRAVAVHIANS